MNIRRKTYRVVGLESKKVYARGKSKSECLRKMNELFPSHAQDPNSKRRFVKKQIYPETMKIKS